MKKFIQFLAEKPVVFNLIRRIIEVNHISLKNVIRKEFSLLNRNDTNIAEEKILDVPCGTGLFSSLFPSNCYQGLDISDKYIKFARKKYTRDFSYGNAMRTGFDSRYFDKILTIGFLHHLDTASVDAVFKEIRRILKPDGVFLLIEDAPITNKFNIIGKFILNNDIGSNVRSGLEYKTIIKNYFTVQKYYTVKSGLFNYSVFVLSPFK